MDVSDLLKKLAARRPVFHSEADFQHELAWEIRTQNPNCSCRLEVPFDSENLKGAIDIVVYDGKEKTAIELKYVREVAKLVHDDEQFNLGYHALDQSGYDCCKDVWRLEQFVWEKDLADRGFLIVLTNAPRFWQDRSLRPTIGDDFAFRDGRRLEGLLSWASHAGRGSTQSRSAVIELRQQYDLKWEEYSQVEGRHGRLRSLVIPISRPVTF